MKVKDLVKALAKVVGSENILASPPDLIAYSYDSTGKRALPDLVVFPPSTAEVSAIVRMACQHQVPVVARGAGTNLSGGTLPSRGGIVLELSRLNRIIEINTAQHRAVVEPGVVNLDLQNALQPLGFMYAPDPASQKTSTLGGNLAENAGGPHCLKYGVTSDHICSAELVLADGSVVQVGASTYDSYGYDLLGPVVGSEGTLGIATRLGLRIVRLPESFQTMLVVFETKEDAGQTVTDIIATGIVPGAMELMDAPVIRAVEASVHAGYPLDAEAILLIELDGVKEGLEREAQRVADICQAHNAQEIKLAGNLAERERLWLGRKGAFGAVSRVRPAYLCQDTTVPRSNLVPMLREVSKIAKKYQLLIGNVFHAGDGNFHPLIMFDNRDPEESERVEKAGKEILAACIPLEGTISGEHGIGLEKLDSIPLMFSHDELELMRRVKNVFDPEQILNPGKVLPQKSSVPPKADFTKTMSQSAPRTAAGLYEQLVKTLGSDNVLANPRELNSYQIDDKLPSLVVFVSNTEHVCQVVRDANGEGMPLIPWGNGSKQATGLPLTKTGVILSLKHMDQLLELDAPNLTVKVEAGINHAELQRELAKHGLCFPLEPSDTESATIGGILATNSSGPKRLAYGTARDLVLGVTVVTPLGEVIRAGGKTMKNVAGYDMRKLFLGSWGTLGVISEAILRLFYLPEERKTLLIRFSNIEDASHVASNILGSFLHPESMELVDSKAAQSTGQEADFGLQEDELLLLIGIAGSGEVVERHIIEIQALAEASDARAFNVLKDTEEQRVWDSQRRINLYSAPGMVRGKAAVPINRIGDTLREVREACARHQIEVGITGHVGSGILYTSLFTERGDTPDSEALLVVADLVKAIDKLGGFFLVESGRPEVRQVFNLVSQRSDYRLMAGLKRSFDPKNIFNPGKVVSTL
ncbi:FAD-binding oxidoreductase [Chloroflexota bacterium]